MSFAFLKKLLHKGENVMVKVCSAIGEDYAVVDYEECVDCDIPGCPIFSLIRKLKIMRSRIERTELAIKVLTEALLDKKVIT